MMKTKQTLYWANRKALAPRWICRNMGSLPMFRKNKSCFSNPRPFVCLPRCRRRVRSGHGDPGTHGLVAGLELVIASIVGGGGGVALVAADLDLGDDPEEEACEGDGNGAGEEDHDGSITLTSCNRSHLSQQPQHTTHTRAAQSPPLLLHGFQAIKGPRTSRGRGHGNVQGLLARASMGRPAPLTQDTCCKGKGMIQGAASTACHSPSSTMPPDFMKSPPQWGWRNKDSRSKKENAGSRES
jgi:hypothetical protein